MSGCAIVLGLSLGQKAAKVSETEVIEYYATKYSRETGGALSDCHAVPSSHPDVWLVVECMRETTVRSYFINVQGVEIAMPRAGPEA